MLAGPIVLVMLAGSESGMRKPVVGLSWEEDWKEVLEGEASATWSR